MANEMDWQVAKQAVLGKWPDAFESGGGVWQQMQYGNGEAWPEGWLGDSWINAYQRMTADVPAPLDYTSPEWWETATDEAVVRAAYPRATFYRGVGGAFSALLNSNVRPWFALSETHTGDKELAVKEARQHPTVQAFERQHNPKLRAVPDPKPAVDTDDNGADELKPALGYEEGCYDLPKPAVDVSGGDGLPPQVDRTKLERLARAATPEVGPRRVVVLGKGGDKPEDGDQVLAYVDVRHRRASRAIVHKPVSGMFVAADIAFIVAASPTAVLALLNALASAESALAVERAKGEEAAIQKILALLDEDDTVLHWAYKERLEKAIKALAAHQEQPQGVTPSPATPTDTTTQQTEKSSK